MHDLNDTLIDILWSGRARWVELAILSLDQNPTPLKPGSAYPREYLEQMIDGLIAVMVRSIQSDPSGLMRFYVESIYPDAIAARGDFYVVLHTVISWMVLFSSELIARLPPEHKVQGSLWLSKFSSVYVTEIVRAGRKLRPTEEEKPPKSE